MLNSYKILILSTKSFIIIMGDCIMRVDTQMKILGIKSDLSLSEIARRLNKTPQAFNQKIKRGSLTIDDLNDIALVTGCKFECGFVFPDGDRITIE